MHDSIRIRNLDEQTAAALADDALARFRPRVVQLQEQDDWEVQVDGETEDDLPDLISILRSRLHEASTTFDVLVNGESYNLNRESY